MSLDYIRNAYGVPAKLGGRVRYWGDPAGERFGTIKGAKGARIKIRLDGDRHANPFHPTWKLEYLADFRETPPSGDGEAIGPSSATGNSGMNQ